MDKHCITKEIIKAQFNIAEEKLNFCWTVLEDLKNYNLQKNDFIGRFIIFQEKLAEAIFNLQLVRKEIIKDEKYYIKNKKKYKSHWFNSKMKNLSNYKKGIDYAVNIAKSIGDAFAYFFYQNEEDLLAKHLDHERITNSSADIGKIGELKFIKNVKHIDGHFTLFHDITNVLRYGDYSFIDLKTLKVEKIGELKTKRIDTNNINLTLTYFKRDDFINKKEPITESKNIQTREERQILGIKNFLTPESSENDYNKKLFNDSYCKEIEDLLINSKINKSNIKNVSNGLTYIALKSKKTSLFNNIFQKDLSKGILNDDNKQSFTEVIEKLIKTNSENNGIVMGQLLYNPDFTYKNTPGTIPLFWHPIDLEQLKRIYFYNTIVISFFNPVHLIEDLNELGYYVDSKYSKTEKDISKYTRGIERFDLFISYIINFLMTENFIIDILSQIENEPSIKGNMRLLIKPNQKVPHNLLNLSSR